MNNKIILLGTILAITAISVPMAIQYTSDKEPQEPIRWGTGISEMNRIKSIDSFDFSKIKKNNNLKDDYFEMNVLPQLDDPVNNYNFEYISKIYGNCLLQHNGETVFAIGYHAFNSTHYIDNNICKWIVISDEFSSSNQLDELCKTNQALCQPAIRNEIPVDDVSSMPESSFSQNYHISIHQNSKTMMQYVTPDFITIGTNSQVTWSNYDEIPVTITSNDPDNPWSTGVILPDEYVTLTFDENGIYEYHGRPGTNGIIVVDDDGQLYSDTFGNAIGQTSPIIYKETSKPVLLYDNCERYASWMTEFQKEKPDFSDNYPRYPPWGNQIFPLVEFCLENGSLARTTTDDMFRWKFQLEIEPDNGWRTVENEN